MLCHYASQTGALFNDLGKRGDYLVFMGPFPILFKIFAEILKKNFFARKDLNKKRNHPGPSSSQKMKIPEEFRLSGKHERLRPQNSDPDPQIHQHGNVPMRSRP